MGIASHGSVILSRGQLVTVEAPGNPRHPSSIQHNAKTGISREMGYGVKPKTLCVKSMDTFHEQSVKH